MATESLPVTVDRSHLIVIGERLYARSLELVRELVNNAYDADAAEVSVQVGEDEVIVQDDGLGMDREGLLRYFQVGVPDKRENPISPRLRRQRIGQFGIGKFATLAACRRFEVYTRRGEFSAKVVFDRDEWERDEGDWRLPMELDPQPGRKRDGTTVRMTALTKRLDPNAIREYLVESVPLKAPEFAVHVNGLKLVPRSLAGRRIPFLEPTPFGVVSGEAVILPASRATPDALGLEVKVRGVTVRRELFGMQAWGKLVTRVRGEVNADFLPLTADRSNFVVDTPEHGAFAEAMNTVMAEVETALRQIALRKENRVARRAVVEALGRIEIALRRHPDLSPFGAIPIGDEVEVGGEAALVEPVAGREEAEAIQVPDVEDEAGELADSGEEPEVPSRDESVVEVARDTQPRVRRLTPNAVIQKVRMGETGLACCIDQFGEDGPESFTEGTIIYLNRDHPLYRHEAAKRETFTRHLARLLTQELALMNEREDPRRAFQQQSLLLRESFSDED
ncbi:MAG TPA: ATP-binding protein [Actinomycetota bacterium]|nr:ATP-binding protein [Actinomycetota bacterium]